MGWITAIGLTIVLLAVGLYALLGVAIIITALVERRGVKPLIEAEPDDPEWQKLGAVRPGAQSSSVSAADSNPYAAPGSATYAETQLRAAAELGFSATCLYRHAKGGIYKTHNTLALSADRQILALVRWGTTASIRNEASVLYSALDDGRYLVTSDRPIGSRTPGFYDEHVFLGASFAQLLRRHQERLRQSSSPVRPLSLENPRAEYEEILTRRARHLVECGEAVWLDAAQTEFRSTFKGAIRTYALTFSTGYIDRSLRIPAAAR